jgi:hypothetical protein
VVTLNWLGTDYIFIIPNGYYSVSDLNFYLQNQCILNVLYVTSGTDNVYFIELVINSIRYSTSLNIYVIPTDAQASSLGYTKPQNATWVYPASPETPSFTFGQQFGNLIRQTFGTYGTNQYTNIQYLSSQTPVISPVDSLILTCNLINSKFSIPSNILFTVPISSALGSLI